ncbi:hypothetical protein D3C72_1356020 [compost metagenome]
MALEHALLQHRTIGGHHLARGGEVGRHAGQVHALEGRVVAAHEGEYAHAHVERAGAHQAHDLGPFQAALRQADQLGRHLAA